MRAIAFAAALSTALAPMAQASCAIPAMLVFDGSASMAELALDPVNNPTRITEARAAVARAMPLVEPHRRIGLMTYGPGGDTACTGVDLHFPPRTFAAADTIARVEALRPEGKTPLAASVAAAAELLNFRTEPGIVVLVTDGNETCGGSPCTLAGRLASQGADLTVHVIGFRGEGSIFQWIDPDRPRFASDTVARCLSDRTGGMFVSTQTVDDLVSALQRTLGCLVVGAAGTDRNPHRDPSATA